MLFGKKEVDNKVKAYIEIKKHLLKGSQNTGEIRVDGSIVGGAKVGTQVIIELGQGIHNIVVTTRSPKISGVSEEYVSSKSFEIKPKTKKVEIFIDVKTNWLKNMYGFEIEKINVK